jgi:transcriptional regulator with GAF, ATPase, and Fis domain
LLDLLAETTRELADTLHADASSISRVIGDVLIMVSEVVPEGRTMQMGHGFLVPDYPLTQKVLTTGVPATLTLTDPDADADEALLLKELGFASLLMLPLEIGGETWGLVEVYRTDAVAFHADDVREAVAIIGRTSARAGG